MVLISITHRSFISHVVQYSKTSWQINYMYYVHFLNLFDLIVFSKFIFSWSLTYLYIIILGLVIQTTQQIIKGFTQNNMTLQYQIKASTYLLFYNELNWESFYCASQVCGYSPLLLIVTACCHFFPITCLKF